MKNTLLAVACLIALGILIMIGVKLYDVFIAPEPENVVTIETPADTNFVPVEKQTYQPPSFFFSKKTSGKKLPRGVKEEVVARVLTVKMVAPNDSIYELDIIETKDGDVFIAKDDPEVKSVRVLTFAPKVFDINVRFGLGLSAGLRNEQVRIMPCGVMSLCEWWGAVQAPSLAADFDGVGPAIGVKLYHDIYLGAAWMWGYDGSRQIKASLSYMF